MMKICLASSHGGHLTETLQILDAFEDYEIIFATYTSPREEELREIAPVYLTNNIGTNPIRLLKAFIWAFIILNNEKPDIVLSLGAEIAIPFIYLSKLFGIKTIFIESWCRVDELSRTGKLVYPVADHFWVQWPQLLDVCGPKAQYKGAVI
jgi:UDP-N-acetylglucosamine:LPS N-acetylglucosamine transferase